MRLVELFLGSLALRPYVFLFLALFLVSAVFSVGRARALLWVLIAWPVAYAAEYASTRVGIPFGPYTYIEATRDRELWISNVPFFDTLSFVFLSYASFRLAVALLGPGRRRAIGDVTLRQSPAAALLGAVLLTMLDLVIDPLTLRGARWFLGPIYTYPEPGIYFGVPLANFGGWAVVGLVIILAWQRVDAALTERGTGIPRTGRRAVSGDVLAIVLYYLVLVFMVSVTFAIGEEVLGLVGLVVHVPVLVLFTAQFWVERAGTRWLRPVPARVLASSRTGGLHKGGASAPVVVHGPYERTRHAIPDSADPVPHEARD